MTHRQVQIAVSWQGEAGREVRGGLTPLAAFQSQL